MFYFGCHHNNGNYCVFLFHPAYVICKLKKKNTLTVMVHQTLKKLTCLGMHSAHTGGGRDYYHYFFRRQTERHLGLKMQFSRKIYCLWKIKNSPLYSIHHVFWHSSTLNIQSFRNVCIYNPKITPPLEIARGRTQPFPEARGSLDSIHFLFFTKQIYSSTDCQFNKGKWGDKGKTEILGQLHKQYNRAQLGSPATFKTAKY